MAIEELPNTVRHGLTEIRKLSSGQVQRLVTILSTAFRNYGDVFSRSGSRPCRLQSTGEFREQVVKFSAGKRPAERSRNRLIAALKG